MFKYVDAHNHITQKLPIDSIYNTYCLNDIKTFSSINKKFKNIGIHPLYIKPDIDYDLIKNLLSSNNINLGEVGLDKNGDNRAEQLKVLITFLDMSKQYNKSITFHCVKSWGVLSETIKNSFDRDLPHMFHGFSGSYEIMKELVGGNSFFSFSLRELKRVKIIHLIKSIPIEKLLIESDMSNDKFSLIGDDLYIKQIKNAYKTLGLIKNIPQEELVPNIINNLKLFLRE